MAASSKSSPGISVAFIVIGILLMIGGLVALLTSGGDGSIVAGALGAAITGLLFLAVSYALTKLHQIERHLSQREQPPVS